MNAYKKISYEEKDYAVIKLNYKDCLLPVVLDWNDFRYINKLNKKWHCNNNGSVSYTHSSDGANKEIYLHELIMRLKNKKKNKPIVHINRIGLDNRSDNLMYDEPQKEINKNIKKKRRTVVLPNDSGIDPDEIPTYIWYMKQDASHGERFVVNIGDIMWKTTSSDNVSLRYKLEEAKLYLRHLLRNRNDLLEDYSMNSDFTFDGKDLSHTYYDIIHLAGYKHIQRFVPENKTFELLKGDYSDLNEGEMQLLNVRRDEFLSKSFYE